MPICSFPFDFAHNIICHGTNVSKNSGVTFVLDFPWNKHHHRIHGRSSLTMRIYHSEPPILDHIIGGPSKGARQPSQNGSPMYLHLNMIWSANSCSLLHSWHKPQFGKPRRCNLPAGCGVLLLRIVSVKQFVMTFWLLINKVHGFYQKNNNEPHR